MTTREVFRLNIQKDDAVKLLSGTYLMAVEARNKTYLANAETVQMIDKVAGFLTDPDCSTFGIMLCGLSGNGKTTMLQAISKVISAGYSVGFSPSAFKTLSIYDAEDILTIARDRDEWRNFKNMPLLAIDDFGKESRDVSTYGNVSSPMIELMEYRYKRMLYTVISTNLNPKEIREKYGLRLADRFAEMFNIVICEGKTFRKKSNNYDST